MKRPDSMPKQITAPWLDLFIATCALTLSVVSVYIGVRSNRTQERTLAASVWPNLQFNNSNLSRDLKKSVEFEIENSGVGPARVESFQLDYDGKLLADRDELLAACCGVAQEDLKRLAEGSVASNINGRVMPAQQVIAFLRFPQDAIDPTLWAELARKREHVRMHACYCSVLDQCWTVDSSKPKPQPVAACAQDEKPQFGS